MYLKPKRRPKVTIAIGLICKKEAHQQLLATSKIYLASDSQTTRGGTKSLDAQKINVVSFPFYEVLIAQAGSAELADKVIELIQAKAQNTKVVRYETILETIQQSVREIRNHLVELNQGCGFSDEAWKRFFLEENYFQLMVAFFYEQKPYLYTIDIDWCLAIPAKSNYCAIGAGKNMAEFLIREFLQSDPNLEHAFTISAAVVEKTIDNVDGCGRPTWIGYAFPMPPRFDTPQKCAVSLVERPLIDILANELRDAEMKSAATRKEQLLEILRTTSQKHLSTLESQVEKEFNISKKKKV